MTIEIYLASIHDLLANGCGEADQHSRRTRRASAWLKRHLLGYKLNCPPGAVPLSTDHYGRPLLSPNPDHYDFNISHSGDWLVAAVTRDHRIGTDIEQIRPGRRLLAIAGQYFHRSETRMLAALSCQARVEYFYQLWVLKEAHLKADGRGIAGGLHHYCYTAVPSADKAAGMACQARSFRMPDGYWLAIACEGVATLPPLRWYQVYAPHQIQAFEPESRFIDTTPTR